MMNSLILGSKTRKKTGPFTQKELGYYQRTLKEILVENSCYQDIVNSILELISDVREELSEHRQYLNREDDLIKMV